MLSVVDHNKGVKQHELYHLKWFSYNQYTMKYAIENLTRSHFSSRHWLSFFIIIFLIVLINNFEGEPEMFILCS